MYTICILVLSVLAVFLINKNLCLYRQKSFKYWLITSCIVGWLEFIFYLRHDAWVFDPSQITGLYILGVTIEDIVFCPCFSVLFYWIYHKLKLNYSQRVFNPDDKMIYAIIVLGIIVFNFNIGSIFGKYMAFRTAMGVIGLLYCWNYTSFRHSLIFMLIGFTIAAGWDIPFVNIGVWVYAQDTASFPTVYDGKLYLKIFKAIFPIELWSYYVSGVMFSFWTIAFFDKYCSWQKKIGK